jgi:hypothetical protein
VRTQAALPLCLALLGSVGACSGDDHHPDGTADAPPETDAADGEDAADACTHLGLLGAACDDDCDCREPFACRGLPGDTSCSVPCGDSGDCVGSPLSCPEARCQLTLGACRCPCTAESECPGAVCRAGLCVGCAADADCAGLDCTGHPDGAVPRCRHDTATCTCGGDCGDAACDPAEAAVRNCPADCPGPCDPFDSVPWGCWDGSAVPWCTCEDGAWSCAPDPADRCPGDVACRRRGGTCSESAEYCYELPPSPDPLGCDGDQPICCLPEGCTGAGSNYYPGSGRCCAGLVGISSLSPMEGMVPGSSAVICMAGCWIRTCTPCGDHTCQLHLGENFCNCPRDCPYPPYTLACDGNDESCGLPHCRQQDDLCTEVTPRCTGTVCAREERPVPDARCDCATARCVVD